MKRTFYEILGVPHDADQAVLDTAYAAAQAKFGGYRAEVRSHRTGAHPVQNTGCREIGFDQVLLLPAQLAGRVKISG